MIKDNIHRIEKSIEEVRARSGRVDSVLLLAVTKNHPVSAVEEAAKAGIKAVGENKVQEAKEKKALYQGVPIAWHLIGHLQTNKVKQAVPLFDLIHSVDSERLLREIDKVAEKVGKVQRILLQINVANEKNKSGAAVEEFPQLVKLAKELRHVRVEGLMCMAPFEEDVELVRPIFRIASVLFEDMKSQFEPGQIRYLSMGMTHDYTVAIEEGANIVRIGTAIFGERSYL